MRIVSTLSPDAFRFGMEDKESADRVIEVALVERADTQAHVICDGALLGDFTAGDRLEVRTAAERVRLLHPPGHDYYRLLRSKLHWGRGSFER